MADAAHKKIDQLYDYAERAVESIGQILGVDVTTPPKAIRASVVENRASNTLPGQAQRALPAPTSPPGPVVRPWEIVEAIDSTTGATVFAVTNGVESADCASRDFAEQVLAAMTAIVPHGQVAPIAMGAGRGRGR